MGEPDVEAMLGRMTSRQVTRWMAYYQIEPFGEVMADHRAGVIAATMANCHKVKGRALKPSDFFGTLKQACVEQPLDVMKAMFVRVKQSFDRVTNGNDRRT